MKICSQCGEEKFLDQFYLNRGKREARCKPCKNALDKRIRDAKKETEILRSETPETVCPCDLCSKRMNCEVECLSFKCWSEYGV
jgi:hypothetical protein